MNEMFLLEIGTRNKLKESYFTWDVKQRYRNEASRQHRIAIEKILEKRRPMNQRQIQKSFSKPLNRFWDERLVLTNTWRLTPKLTALKLALTPELNNLSCWLKANRLSLNAAKTELMIIGSRQRLSVQCDDLEIRIDDQIIKRVDHTKSLGLTIDDHLSWSKHVDEICKKKSLRLQVPSNECDPL